MMWPACPCLFLTAQSLKFAISGDLPNEEGKEVHDIAYNHPTKECHTLLSFALVFLVGLMLTLWVRGKYGETPEELKGDKVIDSRKEERIEHTKEKLEAAKARGDREQVQHYEEKLEFIEEETLTQEEAEAAKENFEEYEHIIRPLEIGQVYFSCGMAWCFFYGTFWTVAATGCTDQDAMLQVIIAIIISAISFSVIWGFDKIEDSGVLGHSADKAILAIIDALGILIGFSWEQAFDVAVDVISEDVDKYIPKTFAKLIMSIMLCTIVFPAWKNYILPTEIELQKETTGLGQKRKRFRDKLDKHQKHMLAGELSEREMDHAHLVLKLHRRKHHGKKVDGWQHEGPGLKPVKDGEKHLKHFLLTASTGLIDVPEDDSHTLIEKLLPDSMKEACEEEEESRWSSALLKIKGALRLGRAASNEEEET